MKKISWTDGIFWHGIVALMKKWQKQQNGTSWSDKKLWKHHTKLVKARMVAMEQAHFQATQQALEVLLGPAVEEAEQQRKCNTCAGPCNYEYKDEKGEELCMKCHRKRLSQGDLRHMLRGATETRKEAAKEGKLVRKAFKAHVKARRVAAEEAHFQATMARVFMPEPPKETRQEYEERKQKEKEDDRPPLTQDEIDEANKWMAILEPLGLKEPAAMKKRPSSHEEKASSHEEKASSHERPTAVKERPAAISREQTSEKANSREEKANSREDKVYVRDQTSEAMIVELATRGLAAQDATLGGDIHTAPRKRKPVPPDCECCFEGAYACAACCAWYPML
jgi:hypothetical protein